MEILARHIGRSSRWQAVVGDWTCGHSHTAERYALQCGRLYASPNTRVWSMA